MNRIFISYKRVDKDRVFEIKSEIETRTGEQCWIDVDGIESDAQFVSVIMRAINMCELFLFMYSKEHSKIMDYELDWTAREIMFAQKKKKRIVFINIDGSELTDWFEFMFGTKQQVNILDNSVVERLCADIKKWLGIQSVDVSDKDKAVEQKHMDKLLSDTVLEEKELFPYFSKGKFGFKDETGEIVIKCKYDAAYNFSEGFACVMLNGKWGFIDKTGREIVKCKYDTAYDFSGGFARVVLDGELGVVDKLGNYVVKGHTNETLKDTLEYIPVPFIKNGKFGFKDETGKIVIKCKYDAAYNFSEGFACVMLNGKWGFIDKTGREIVKCKYDTAYDFSGGFARVVFNGEQGLVDKYGNSTCSDE